MEWQELTVMCNYANREQHKEFFRFVSSRIEEFENDEMSQDMLFTAIPLDQVKNFKKECEIILARSKKWKFDSFRTALRSAMFEQILEEK
jgi:hypothetical protein